MLVSTYSLKKTLSDYNAFGLLSALVSDYLSGEKKLREFYQYDHNIAAFGEAIANRRSFATHRPHLAAALRNQHQLFKNDFPLVDENISLLEKENTFTVTTGHQLCIFTGPLYYIYKILSTINLAETLKKAYPECNFVPVYWLNGEDHDFEEINHIHVFNSKLEWNQELKGPAGRLPTESMVDILSALKTLMGESANATELFELFEDAYRNNSTLAAATRFLVTHLFGKYGLVIVDGDDQELKHIFKPIIKLELEEQPSFSKVEETSAALTKLGYKTQVHPREINLFYMGSGFRERIVSTASGKYEVLNTGLTFNQEELIAMTESNPENFSPNVVLRPVYQEYILPNLAYVGGPGELSYWLQYKSLFEMQKVHFPVLVLRSSALMIENKSLRRLDSLNISLTDLFKPADELSASYINKQDEGKFDFEMEKQNLQRAFDQMKAKVAAIDKSLEGSVAAEYQRTLNAIDNLQKKTMAALKRKHDTAISQLKNLQEKVLPKGVFQERYLNFIPFYIQYGNTFINRLKENLPVFENKVVVLEESAATVKT